MCTCSLTQGDLLRSLISQGNGKQVNGADSFYVDSFDNLLISDWGSHQVKIFSDGTLVIIHSAGEVGAVQKWLDVLGILTKLLSLSSSNIIVCSNSQQK